MEYINAITFDNGITFVIGAIAVCGFWYLFKFLVGRWADNKAIKEFSKN